MHEWVESEIPAILLGLIIILIVSLGFAHQITVRPSRKDKKIQKSAGEDSTKAELDTGALAEYKSMLATSSLCAICQNPTTRRCSRCKSVRYCSSACQGQDWREGHRKECRAPDTSSLARSGSDSGILSNGCIPQRGQSADSKNLLDSLSSRSSRSDSNSNSADFSHSNGEEVKLSQFEKTVCNPISSDGNLLKPKQILFPYDYFVELFNWDLLSLPCGLINCGNSCFANVVLQCLTYTRPLTAYLLEGGHGEDCRRTDWCFMCELQSHVWKVTKNQNAFSPIRILSRIRNIGGNLGYGRQEDAHEFMRFAIDSMQSICLDEVGGEKAVDPATQETTLIHHIFGGHLQSQVKCLQCQHESNRYENMMDLAVEIHGFVESLEDAIAQFTAPEMLDGENKYQCDRCNAYVKARKRLTVHEAPNIMTIALKRFQSGKFGKLNKRVTFPEVLDMAPYMSGKGDNPPVYRLYAVVVHVDMLNASFFGHYICYVKDSHGVWYKIDDSKVKEVELDKVMSQRAYMLFYSRSVARKAPMTEGQSAAPATVPVSVSTIDMDRLTVPIEPQRSSIFPPTLGTVAVPTDLARGYSSYEALTPDPEEDESDVTEHQEVLQRSDASGKEVDDDVGESSFETKETDLELASTGTSEGEELSEDTNLYDQNVSSPEVSATVLGFRNTNGHASTSQFSDSIQFLNGIVEQNGVPADSTGDSLDRGGKRTHDGLSYFSGPRPLNSDQSPVLAAESNGRSFSSSPVADSGGTTSSSSVWPKRVTDLVSSSVSSMLNDGLAVSLEHKGQPSVEADMWKDELSARAKRQHLELSSGRLGYTGPGVNGNCRLMEIDEANEGGESHKNSQRFLEVLSDECAGKAVSGQLGHEMQGGRGLIQSSSKDLLQLESLCGRSAYQESHPEGLLRGEVSVRAIRIPWVSTVPFLTETPPGESTNIAQPSQGRVLIEELPEPITNFTNLREESEEDVLDDGYSFDLKTVEEVIMEDDAPYMIMEPISIEPEHFEEFPSQREEMVGQASEETVSDVQKITKEKADAAASSVESLESFQIEQGPQEGGGVCSTEISPVDILKIEKQIIKPLIAPGFFNRSPRPRSAKSLNKKMTTINDNEGNSQSHDILVDMSGETGHAGIALIGTEAGDTEKQVPNGKPSSQARSNGNHSNGKTPKVKESIEPTSDIKNENGDSPALVGDCSATGKHKQGRNESCACGSQQKWKKCCGKASAIKGGLPARRLVV